LGALVAWETRRGSSYYYRSKWVDGRVRKEYLGTGPLAKIVALQDERRRRQKEEAAASFREERERLEADVAFLRELEEAAEILVRASLLADGFKCRKGEWRRERERA
jgi:hypothetical protein